MTTPHLNDLAMIRLFLAAEESLASNPHLQIQSTLYARQLLDRRQQIVATLPTRMAADKSPKLVSVRRKSEYWALLHQVLQEQGFVPSEKLKQSEFVSYQQRDIPAGYALNLTEARILWRSWWTRQRLTKKSFGLELDLLILTRDNWYPVQDIACNQGTLFIKTLVGEMALQGGDQVQWLERQGTGAAASPEYAQRRAEARSKTQTASPVPSSPAPPPEPLTVLQMDDPPAATANSGSVSSPRAADYPARTPRTIAPTSGSVIPPEWQAVLRQVNGKVYVKTELGYVLIEGQDLQVSVRRQGAATGEPSPRSTVRAKPDFMNTSTGTSATGTSATKRSLLMDSAG